MAPLLPKRHRPIKRQQRQQNSEQLKSISEKGIIKSKDGECTSEPEASEVVNVIKVDKKKQRVNEYYLQPDDNYDSEEEYNEEDEELDRYWLERVATQGQPLTVEVIRTLSRDLVDDLAEERLSDFCRNKFTALKGFLSGGFCLPCTPRTALLRCLAG